MRSMLTKISWLNVAALLLWVLFACTSPGTTAPNPIYQRPYPSAYNILKLRNSLLAQGNQLSGRFEDPGVNSLPFTMAMQSGGMLFNGSLDYYGGRRYILKGKRIE